MKKKILTFIKKYPMRILLAIIALNLMSIAGSLKTSAKLDQKKLYCLEGYKYEKEGLEKKIGVNYENQCARLFNYYNR